MKKMTLFFCLIFLVTNVHLVAMNEYSLQQTKDDKKPKNNYLFESKKDQEDLEIIEKKQDIETLSLQIQQIQKILQGLNEKLDDNFFQPSNQIQTYKINNKNGKLNVGDNYEQINLDELGSRVDKLLYLTQRNTLDQEKTSLETRKLILDIDRNAFANQQALLVTNKAMEEATKQVNQLNVKLKSAFFYKLTESIYAVVTYTWNNKIKIFFIFTALACIFATGYDIYQGTLAFDTNSLWVYFVGLFEKTYKAFSHQDINLICSAKDLQVKTSTMQQFLCWICSNINRFIMIFKK